MMSKSFKIALLISMCVQHMVVGATFTEKITEWYYFGKSALRFYPSIACNAFKHGSFITFNRIAGDVINDNVTTVKNISYQLDEAGNIIKLHDGKKTPLLLGSIPLSKDHIQRIKNACNISPDDILGLYSLTMPFENNLAGLLNIIRNDPSIQSFAYPTIDLRAPTIAELMRIVRDLEHRDNEVTCAYVHCRAGRGRSALAVAAYIAYVFHTINVEVTPAQIEAYLRLCRPQVYLYPVQKAALATFQQELRKLGNLEALNI